MARKKVAVIISGTPDVNDALDEFQERYPGLGIADMDDIVNVKDQPQDWVVTYWQDGE
ncbi:hypothetical protein AB0C84_44625 [Actinomadura sp. NPDC048955]|uniref:hypothetical protein n=1 Tax=Actinomadura sp. NPDC048955 TaxID=3158228 RepID=UPI0033CD5A1A